MTTDQNVRKVLQRIKDKQVLMSFYEKINTDNPFPEAEIEALYPQHVVEWRKIADLHSAPWVWVMFCEISLTNFLMPTGTFPFKQLEVGSFLGSDSSHIFINFDLITLHASKPPRRGARNFLARELLQGLPRYLVSLFASR